MSRSRVDAVANAVLYEGYALYPYRPSSVKNRRRFNFGVLAPRAAVEREDHGYLWQLRTECVVQGDAAHGPVGDGPLPAAHATPATTRRRPRVAEPWLEATERIVVLPPTTMAALADRPGARQTPFAFDGLTGSGRVVGRTAVRRRLPGVGVGGQHHAARPGAVAGPQRPAAGRVRVHARHPDGGRRRLRLAARPARRVARRRWPACTNTGVWPVLAGEPGQRDVMLASPIILYDYPEVAAESPGDLFDGAEIDEILTLRILTLTDEEKDEMRRADARTRQLLERTEALTPEHMRRLHGVMHGARDPRER